MGYRFIFSQMFDVRPRNNAGDLDVEKIKRIGRILNLRLESSAIESERIINLKNSILEPAEESVYLKTDEGVEGNEPAEKFLDFWPQAENFSDITRDNIVSIMEIIEATEQAMKNNSEIKFIPTRHILKRNEMKARRGRPVLKRQSTSAAVRLTPTEHKTFEVPIRVIEKEEIAEELVALLAEEKNVPFSEVEQDTDLAEQKFIIPEVFEDLAMSEKEMGVKFETEENPLSEKSLGDLFAPTWHQNLVFRDVNEVVLPGFVLGRKNIVEIDNRKNRKKPLTLFIAAAVIIALLFPAVVWLEKVLALKGDVLNSGMTAYESLLAAKDSLSQLDFPEAQKNFEKAYNNFASADSQINSVAGPLVFLLERLPGFSFVSSRLLMLEAGQEMSKAGKDFSEALAMIQQAGSGAQGLSITSAMEKTKNRLETGLASLVSVKYNLDRIKIEALPPDIQPQLAQLKDKMPEALQISGNVLDWMDKFLAIIGQGTPKKYLLIFQNTAEARATGGFIGTYGILDLQQGEIKNIFIDNVFNADGQLREKVVPPKPIQKISTAWSMHDANWFADFPTSAKKIMWFYEKTGGETPDGVISLTPTVVERLLKLTGPIDLPQYGIKLDENNFEDITQYDVEVNYDKEENQPKKILSDFAPKFIEKIGEQLKQNNLDVIKIINDCLIEKQILVYFSDEQLENFAKHQGWTGEVLDNQQDFFLVVNSNINGFKTDRVIEQSINHTSEISEDGSIIDTIEITRHHTGGSSVYDWYNAVNADYLRVYLPRGAELISAEGQTPEQDKPPVDYTGLGFKIDPDVQASEATMKIDEKSGTQIFEESGKTVFGNWTYVSPGETIVLKYQYRLPFKIDLYGGSRKFSLLAQKQSGTDGGKIEAKFILPSDAQIIGSNNEDLKIEGNMADFSGDLTRDRYLEINY